MANASAALDPFAALGDATRRRIVEALAARPSPVGELAATLPVTRSAVSQHLRVLKEAGLVLDTSEGARRIYRLDPRGIGAVRAWLDQHWSEALTSFKAFAEADADPEPEEER